MNINNSVEEVQYMKGTKRLICLLLTAAFSLGFVFGAAAKEYERVVITYTCPQVVAGYDYNAGDDYSKFILDKFNFEFQGTNVPWGNGTTCPGCMIPLGPMTSRGPNSSARRSAKPETGSTIRTYSLFRT